MKIKDLRKKSSKDLQKEAEKLRAEIAASGVNTFTTEDKNVKKVRNARKDLARILTLLNEKPVEADDQTKKAEDK